MALPIIPAIAIGVRVASRGISKGVTSIIKGSSRILKGRKKSSKGDKKKAKEKENKNKESWIDSILDWGNKERVKKPLKEEIKQQQVSPKKKDYKEIEHQSFIKKKFFYKEQKFSDNKVLNTILNDLSKKNKLKEHNLNEISDRIDFIFNRTSHKKDIEHIRTEKPIEEVHIPPKISDFPTPSTSSDSLWDFWADDIKRKKSFRRRLKEVRAKLRKRLRNIRARVKVAKQKALKVSASIKRKLGFKSSRIDSIKETSPKKVETLKTKRDVKEPTPTKETKSQKEYDSRAPKSKTTNFPDLEKGLGDVKARELQTKQEIEKLESNYNKDKIKIEKEIDDIKSKLEKNKWYDTENAKLKAKQALAYTRKTKLIASYESKILYTKTEGIYKQINSLKNSLSEKAKEVLKSSKEIFPRMFKESSKGIKALAPISRRIPLVGSILYAIIAVADISKAKNAWEVRKAIGEAIGGSIGGILGTALGSFLPLIGNIVFGILGALLGEMLGKTAVQFGLEPLDFLPFELYDAPNEIKQQSLLAGFEYSKGDLYDWAVQRLEPMIEETQKYSYHLDSSERKSDITTFVKKSSATAVNSVGLGNEETQYDFSSVNPEAIEGAVVRVVREKAGIDWKGRGFVAGHISIIDGSGKSLFEAQTTERPVEGTIPNRNLRIPAGTYNMFWGGGSKHPDRPVLYNDQVPASRAIMIHKGNSVAWSAGCVVISRGNPWGKLVGRTGEKSDAEKAGHELMLVLKKLSGLNPSKKYYGKQLALKTQIFNNFNSGDLSAAKGSKGAEVYQSAPQDTVNKTIINNNTIVLKPSA